MRTQPFFEQGHDAGAGDRGVDKEIGGSADAHNQWYGHVDLYGFPVPLDLPDYGRPTRSSAGRQLWPSIRSISAFGA